MNQDTTTPVREKTVAMDVSTLLQKEKIVQPSVKAQAVTKFGENIDLVTSNELSKDDSHTNSKPYLFKIETKDV